MKRLTVGKALALCIILSVVSETGCTPKQIASDITSQIFKGGAPSFEMESDVGLAENSAVAMLNMMEAFQYDNPHNKNYQILLARSFGNYAFGFLEWNMMKYKDVDPVAYELNQKRAKDFYLKGKTFGLMALSRNSAIDKALSKDVDALKKALKGAGRSQLPAMFWTAFNWGSSINLNKSSPLAIVEFPKVEAIMQRVVEIDENYFFASPDFFFGFSYGSRPTMFGGNPEKSKQYFEKGIAAYKRKFLMGLVLYAQSYAIQTQDKTLFESLLNEVLTTPADSLPEQRLANEMAKLRARWLLDHESNYF